MDATHTIISQVAGLSYLGIFVLSLLANFVVPVPEEIILIAIGYVLGTGHLHWYLVGPIVFLGLIVSDLALYELSYRGNKIVGFIYEKYFSKLVPFDNEFIHSHVRKIIVFARFLIQLRFLSPFFAGYTKTKRKTFLAYDTMALLVYVPFYLFIGFYFRNRFEDIVSGLGAVKNIVLVVIGIVILVGVTKTLKAFFLGQYQFARVPGKEYRKTWIPGLNRRLASVKKEFHIKKV